jgi:hypothetical protein
LKLRVSTVCGILNRIEDVVMEIGATHMGWFREMIEASSYLFGNFKKKNKRT